MKNFCRLILIAGISFFVLFFANYSYAKDTIKVELDPVACNGGGCPTGLEEIYQSKGETCVTTFDEFKQDPSGSHFWVQDPEVKAQGQGNERARQFISWVLNKNALDNHPVLKTVWNTTRNLAYFFVILMAAILGIGFIVGQRANFDLKIKLWPAIGKIAAALLFITFSASIVLFFIQMSELMMKFFMENLGGKDLFNIYFASAASQEANYIQTPGCRDLNFGVQEAARSEMFMMQVTNITYYVMGIIVILRKIILWFLLFVSPFLAILFPFVFIRNIGWIWIGVFFQWLFYGPLFALFLGALSRIWKEGIPFIFDFSRAGKPEGYIFPTGIDILYGGPAQKLGALNNGNYIDTFVEYVITVIMLWTVILLPWLLLRIFRNYCCDGIYAMKNILLSLYDQMRNPPQTPMSPSNYPNPVSSAIGATMRMAQEMQIPLKAKLETVEEIKRTKTEEIVKSMNLSATKLTDIARLETNHQVRETVKQNFEYLANPTKAQTPTERQKYMNIRTELFSRAIKDDRIAKQILSATSSSTVEQLQSREKILQTAPKAEAVTQVISYKLKIPVEKISAITASLADTVSSLETAVNSISQNTQVPGAQVKTILSSYKAQTQQPPAEVVQTIAKETGITKEQVASVIKQVANIMQTNKEIVKDVAQKQEVSEQTVQTIIQEQMPVVAEPQSHIEKTIAIPPTVSIEDYEEVKKMWVQQYEKGEVPVTENMTSRADWIDQDIVFITNTLNKILSADQKMKQQGFDDVGFILPIFMINNLKGEELLVYLKAKLEAAKQVQDQMDKEKEITEKLKAKTEEVLVDVNQKKSEENEKTMTMAEELPIDENKEEKKEEENPVK